MAEGTSSIVRVHGSHIVSSTQPTNRDCRIEPMELVGFEPALRTMTNGSQRGCVNGVMEKYHYFSGNLEKICTNEWMHQWGNVSAGRALNPQCKGQTMESHRKSWVIVLVGKQVKVLKNSHRRGSLKKQDQWVKGQTYNAITCTSLPYMDR